jgi:long-chain acyl-CoA synthetase
MDQGGRVSSMENPLPRTYNQRFEEIARHYPDRTAFRMKTPEGYSTVTYREAYSQARAVASGLIALGINRGSPVAILSENRPEWAVVYLGIYLSGMVAVPLDTQISPPEWRRLMDDSETQTVFVSGLLALSLREAIRDSRPPRRVICFDSTSGDRDARSELAGLIEWATALPSPPTLPECQPSDTVTIIYTSGTTGTPKGVMLTQSNVVQELQCIFGAIHADEMTRYFLLPRSMLASVINVLSSIGAHVVFADTLSARSSGGPEEAGITILTVPQFFYLFTTGFRRFQKIIRSVKSG